MPSEYEEGLEDQNEWLQAALAGVEEELEKMIEDVKRTKGAMDQKTAGWYLDERVKRMKAERKLDIALGTIGALLNQKGPGSGAYIKKKLRALLEKVKDV